MIEVTVYKQSDWQSQGNFPFLDDSESREMAIYLVTPQCFNLIYILLKGDKFIYKVIKIILFILFKIVSLKLKKKLKKHINSTFAKLKFIRKEIKLKEKWEKNNLTFSNPFHAYSIACIIT